MNTALVGGGLLDWTSFLLTYGRRACACHLELWGMNLHRICVERFPLFPELNFECRLLVGSVTHFGPPDELLRFLTLKFVEELRHPLADGGCECVHEVRRSRFSQM